MSKQDASEVTRRMKAGDSVEVTERAPQDRVDQLEAEGAARRFDAGKGPADEGVGGDRYRGREAMAGARPGCPDVRRITLDRQDVLPPRVPSF